MSEHVTTEWMVDLLFTGNGLTLDELQVLRERLLPFSNDGTIVSFSGTEYQVGELREVVAERIRLESIMHFGLQTVATAVDLQERGISDAGEAIHMVAMVWLDSLYEQSEVTAPQLEKIADRVSDALGDMARLADTRPAKELKPYTVAQQALLQAIRDERRTMGEAESALRLLSRQMHLPDVAKVLRKLDTARAAQNLHRATMLREDD